MLFVPASDKRKLLDFTLEIIEQCRVSQGMRASLYRTLNTIAETGRSDGNKALINYMQNHLQRTADHLFSPVELKFALDFDSVRPAADIERGAVAAKTLTRTWERQDIDFTFGNGVRESLKYGACILKQWVEEHAKEKLSFNSKLVMPWQFGVYREDETSLDKQQAMCETSLLTMPEVWRRIYHLPKAQDFYKRIAAHARRGESADDPASYFHQVLSTSQLNTSGLDSARPLPGGILSIGGGDPITSMGPIIAPETVQFHELWVQDETDYTTIQLIEPDIIIAPLFKKANLLVPGQHPYTLIQPNQVTNWIWGRSELIDLIEPQNLLATWCDDLRRLFGLQVDKILAFAGDNTITDEVYAQFRTGGYTNLTPGSSVQDLTPKIPPEALPLLNFMIQIINTLGSFPEIMQGKGEAGVRAGVHANTLLKTASPTLRKRALLVERQCEAAADLTLTIREAKDPNPLWVNADNMEAVEQTKFLLTDLPDDWRVKVDSHSSSPIFSDENQQLIMGGLRMGYLDAEYAIDNLPYPNKEAAKVGYKKKSAAKKKQMDDLMKSNPEIAEKVQLKELTGGKR